MLFTYTENHTTSITLNLIEANLMVITNLKGQVSHTSLNPCQSDGHSSYVDETASK